MKTRRFCSGGSIHTLRGMKKALADARRERNTEKDKALLCALQRDYYSALVQYFDEYVIFASRNTEQTEQGRTGYDLFGKRMAERYGAAARPIAAALFPERAATVAAWKACEPYYRALRMIEEAEQRKKKV